MERASGESHKGLVEGAIVVEMEDLIGKTVAAMEGRVVGAERVSERVADLCSGSRDLLGRRSHPDGKLSGWMFWVSWILIFQIDRDLVLQSAHRPCFGRGQWQGASSGYQDP